jgi:hypothetical protein
MAADKAEAGEWDCEAYGPEGRLFSALCFFSKGGRICASAADCAVAMAIERRRVWQAIHDGARAGDPDMIFLARSFPTPETILNGDGHGQAAVQ